MYGGVSGLSRIRLERGWGGEDRDVETNCMDGEAGGWKGGLILFIVGSWCGSGVN